MSFEFTLLDALQALRCPVLDALAVFFDQAGAHGEIWIAFTAVLLAFRRTRRAGLAMALAQKPKILLLDEPTTYLDVHHQLELMELVVRLHNEMGLTVIMVLHDLNHAARYSERLIALKKGTIMADGPTDEVFTQSVIEELYDVKAVIMRVEANGTQYPVCFPYSVEEHD